MYEFGTKNERRGELRCPTHCCLHTSAHDRIIQRRVHIQLEPDTASKLAGLFDDARMRHECYCLPIVYIMGQKTLGTQELIDAQFMLVSARLCWAWLSVLPLKVHTWHLGFTQI